MEHLDGFFGENSGEKEQILKEYIGLAKKIIENLKVFDFPGIDPDAYSKLKDEEAELQGMDYVFPEMITPIDDLINKFAADGIKLMSGNDSESGNYFIVSVKSENKNITANSIFPWQLQIAADMDDDLANLVMLGRKFHSLCKPASEN